MKKILLFGASSGIGQEIQKILSSKENEIVCVNRKDCDLSELEETSKYIDKLKDNFDWIIYCSGVLHKSEKEKSPDFKLLKESYSVNTLSPILIFSKMREKINEAGGIIYISSTAVFKPNSDFPLYSSSKRATESFLKTESENFPNKKTVVIIPGPTNTKMRQAIFSDADKCQPAEFVANIVKEITIDNKYKNGDSIVIKNSTVSLETLAKY